MRSRAQRSIKSFSESVHPSRIGLASSSQACAKEYTREVSRRENGRREPAYDPAEDGETYLRCRTTACRRTGPSSCPRRRSPRRRRGRLLRGLGAQKKSGPRSAPSIEGHAGRLKFKTHRPTWRRVLRRVLSPSRRENAGVRQTGKGEIEKKVPPSSFRGAHLLRDLAVVERERPRGWGSGGGRRRDAPSWEGGGRGVNEGEEGKF